MSNTTYMLQPLNKYCSLKFKIFMHALLYFTTHRKEEDILKWTLGDIFTPTSEKSMTQANMKSEFWTTGIFHPNPFILLKMAFEPNIPTGLPSPETCNTICSSRQLTTNYKLSCSTARSLRLPDEYPTTTILTPNEFVI